MHQSSQSTPVLKRLCWRMTEKVQDTLARKKQATSCNLLIGLPGPRIVVATLAGALWHCITSVIRPRLS